MTDRHFRLWLGAALIAALYYDQLTAASFLVGYLVFEGLTNWRLPLLIARIRNQTMVKSGCGQSVQTAARARFDFDAERAWRLIVASSLIISMYLLPKEFWWLAWFIGFALFGAGISGVCPMLIALRVAGFR